MKLAIEWDGDLANLMSDYNYQPDLTRKLDGVTNQSFDQTLVNEIVLWKVNRFAPISQNTLVALNGVANYE
jgi:hypothetical protein